MERRRRRTSRRRRRVLKRASWNQEKQRGRRSVETGKKNRDGGHGGSTGRREATLREKRRQRWEQRKSTQRGVKQRGCRWHVGS